MHNELLSLVLAIFDILFVFIAARMGAKRLFGLIALNLILVSIFGAKLITLFGYTTNVGNILYACVFLATYFLLQRQDKKETLPTIWFGVVCVFFFLAISQIIVHFAGVVPTGVFDSALKTVFSFSLRIAVASALAYVFAQYVNIYLFVRIKDMTGGRFLWLQAIGATIVAQLIDSCLFFTIAFLDMSGTLLVQAILVGWVVKIAVVVLATPVLYFDRYLLTKK